MILPRKAVQAMQPYLPPLEGRRDRVRLDFNETTTGFPWAYDDAVPADVYTAYPEYGAFLARLAEVWGIPRERILLTNASDEGLFVIAFTFVEPDRDVAVTAAPTFALIPHSLRLVQSRLVEVPITDHFEFDVNAIDRVLTEGARLAMFASPDNPVGCALSVETVARWCRSHPDTLFAIDEAYAEYSGVSVLGLIDRFDNLLVTRTFSKAWGMAGLRLGVVIGQESLIEAMSRVRSPYSVNSYALTVATRLLANPQAVAVEARATMARKARVVAAVRARGLRVVEGRANFFMIDLGERAKDFCAFFRERGVLVRDRSSMFKLAGMVRVSIGSEREMALFGQVLEGWVG